MRISGIPETKDEDVYHKTLETLNSALHINPPLDMTHIDRLHRTGKPRTDDKARQVLVKFTSYRARQKVTSKRSLLDGTQLYLNEDLTKKRNHLFWCTRMAKRNKQVKDCWTIDGRVIVRDLNNVTHELRKQCELQELIGEL